MSGWAPFRGAKIALLHGRSVLTLLRDDRPGLPYPGHWDLPGGGREGGEGPLECVLRELVEEAGLQLPASRVEWARAYPAEDCPGLQSYFFGARISAVEVASVRLGDEGQGWRMMPVEQFLAHPRAVNYLQARLADWLNAG